MRISTLVIVNGYGCNLHTPLRPYLDKVLALLRETPAVIIFCGGYTQRKRFPGLSEAYVMADYVREQVPELDCYIEDDSYTTYENIRNAAEVVRKREWEPDQIIVFCEAQRAPKTDMLVRHFFGRRATIMTDSWELASPVKELVHFAYDWLALKFPILARIARKKRIRRAEQL